ncbi:hypothetical protein RTP6_007641 [Batrachochytrium dendrobatidis]
MPLHLGSKKIFHLVQIQRLPFPRKKTVKINKRLSRIGELAGTELQSTEKLVIDDERYNPDLKQDYFVIDGDQAYKKGDYWGRDAFVAVLLEYIPKPPSMDEQPETPSTPTQPGLFSGLWSMIWPEEKKPLDPPKSLKQKIDEYHASVKLLSGKYLSWTEKYCSISARWMLKTLALHHLN